MAGSQGGFARRASPHTRGWTRTAAEAGDPHVGFPAHAGMDPRPGPSTPRTRRIQGLDKGQPISYQRDMGSAQVLKRLTRDGWILRNVKGSHFHFTHPDEAGARDGTASAQGTSGPARCATYSGRPAGPGKGIDGVPDPVGRQRGRARATTSRFLTCRAASRAGDTLAEALGNAKEAVECHLEGMLMDGERIPQPSADIKVSKGQLVGIVPVDLATLQRAVA